MCLQSTLTSLYSYPLQGHRVEEIECFDIDDSQQQILIAYVAPIHSNIPAIGSDTETIIDICCFVAFNRTDCRLKAKHDLSVTDTVYTVLHGCCLLGSPLISQYHNYKYQNEQNERARKKRVWLTYEAVALVS